MSNWRRALILGLVDWVVVFIIGFLAFPLREPNRPLFESIMAVAVTLAAVVLGLTYLKRVEGGLLREGVLLGILWLAINLLVDAPLMLLGGPMQMTLGQYAADIGVTYLSIPAVTVGLAMAKAGGASAP